MVFFTCICDIMLAASLPVTYNNTTKSTKIDDYTISRIFRKNFIKHSQR